MKNSLLSVLALLVGVGTVVVDTPAFAQDAAGDQDLPAATVTTDEEYVLDYSDYTVKGYSLSFGAGMSTGVLYLDLEPYGERTVYPINTGDEMGPGDVLGFDNLPLDQARARAGGAEIRYLWDTTQKEIKSGPAFSGRVGIYIAENFHLDVAGTYAMGEAEVSMVYRGETTDYFTNGQRYYGPEMASPGDERSPQAYRDEDFSVIKGGVGLMYDAKPAKFFGITPRLGFGLGGIINSYSSIDDKTALYLEGTFALDYSLGRSVNIFAQADLTSFSFEIEELGYKDMTNYTMFTFGLSWFIDVLPPGVREAHTAGR